MDIYFEMAKHPVFTIEDGSAGYVIPAKEQPSDTALAAEMDSITNSKTSEHSPGL